MSDRFILIGHPVGHSISPTIHGAAYEELGRAGEYSLVDAPDESAVRAQVERVRSGDLVGANVTVPWKLVALESADRVHESARDVGVANVLARDESGLVVAYNTDALGLSDDLLRARQEHLKLEPDAATRSGALVVGNGGAARAAVVACKMAGFSPIYVTARRFSEAEPRSSWPQAAAFEQLGAELLAWPADKPALLGEVIPKIGVLVQGTSAGMKGTSGGEQLAQCLHLDLFNSVLAYDLVYVPVETPFLKLARQSGHHGVGGLGMLVGQAARAIEIWWGERPDDAPLLQAARKALGL